MNEGGDPVTLESPVRPESVAELEQHIKVAAVPAAAEAPIAGPPPVFELQNFSAYYGTFRAIKDIRRLDPAEPDHGVHRTFGQRQEHRAALAESNERPRARALT